MRLSRSPRSRLVYIRPLSPSLWVTSAQAGLVCRLACQIQSVFLYSRWVPGAEKPETRPMNMGYMEPSSPLTVEIEIEQTIGRMKLIFRECSSQGSCCPDGSMKIVFDSVCLRGIISWHVLETKFGACRQNRTFLATSPGARQDIPHMRLHLDRLSTLIGFPG